jgi:phosphomannomutase/phosphoglucomutase
VVDELSAKTLLGTNGIRGVVNQELTPEFVVKVGVAIGTYFGGGRILIGHDCRTSNTIFLNAITAGLASTGCTVLVGGCAPTPALQYAVNYFELNGAVIVTASHNPAEYNGIKVVGCDGTEISREEEEKIEKSFFEGSFTRSTWNQLGSIQSFPGVIDTYKGAVKTHLDVEAIGRTPFKVVVDPVNSVGGLVTPSLLKDLGCTVVTINAQLDGDFSRPPEPKPETLGDLSAVVKALHADLGVAHDGDADRCMFVDERGTVVWGDKTGAVLLDYVLKKIGENIVVTPISSSKLIEDIVKRNGSKLVWTRVGSTIVTNTMKEMGADVGFEDNGGFFYTPHQPVRDGALAAAMMLEVLAKSGKPLSKLIEDLPKYALVKERIECPNDKKPQVSAKVLKQTEGMNRLIIDGVKIFFDDGSVLVRPSGTEAIYRVYAEAQDEKRAREIADWGVAMVTKAL